MAKTPAQRPVQCYHCRHRFDVGAMTQSTVCPACNKSLVVQDLIINTLKAVRKIQTCGRVIVQKKGHVIAALVEANEGVQVDGVMDSAVVTQGAVRLGKTAHWKGNCRAPSLAAESGCVITSGLFEIYPEPPHSGHATPAASPERS